MANIDEWGVTEKGFYRPTLEEIITEKNKKAIELFGENFDVGELTPQGKFFRINAAAESKLCQIAENIYYSISPSTARGISLDRVCDFANLSRASAGYAVLELFVYGKQGYTVPAGTLFKNPAGVEFYSTQDTEIINEEQTEQVDENGEPVYIYYAKVPVQCRQSGTVGNVINVNATSEVNQDITAVTYGRTLAEGTDVESDTRLRERFYGVVEGLGINTEAAIKANVLRVSGVKDVMIINNNTPDDMVISDKLTVVSGSYAIVVHSSDKTINDEIAAAIFEKAPLGIIQCGNQVVAVKDESGVDQTVKFSYVAEKSIEVIAKCAVTKEFPSNGTDLITQKIMDYISSLGIGETVVYSRFYDYLYDIPGVYEVTELSVNGEKNNIEISAYEKAEDYSIIVSVAEV